MRIRIPGRFAWPVVLTLVLVGGGYTLAYASGLVTVLSYGDRHVTFAGIGGSRLGFNLGLTRMYLFEGQTFYAEYDATVKAGSLRVAIWRTFGPIGKGPHLSRHVGDSGSGVVTFTVPESGLYTIRIDGSPLGGKRGGGYDVAYSVIWGAR